MKSKIAAIVLGVLGSVLAIFLGISWMSDYFSLQDKIKAFGEVSKALKNPVLQAQMAQLGKLYIASYILLIGGVLSLLASIFLNKLKIKSAIILIAVPVIAAVLAPKSLVFSFFMIISAAIIFIKRNDL